MPRKSTSRKPISEEFRCTAKVTSGTRRCKNAAIPGGTVCRDHGGDAPQVRLAARRRLDSLATTAVDLLHKSLLWAIETKEYEKGVRTALGVLDRTGFGPNSKIELTGQDGGPIQVENYIPLEALSLNTKLLVLKEVEEWRKKQKQEEEND